eukprot:Skav218850  [mRNA]  locus=scaffold2397:91381:92736:+ [translate_table: standard]
MADASDDEAEADEDLDHLGSVGAVPRSDADHLRQLESLGINADAEGREDAVDDVTPDDPVAKRQKLNETENSQTEPIQHHEETQTATPMTIETSLSTTQSDHKKSSPDSAEGTQRLRGGSNWFKAELNGSGVGAVLENYGAVAGAGMEVRHMLVKHHLIRACKCHVQISEDLSAAHVFAKGYRAALEARKILELSADAFKNTVLQLDANSVIPDGCEEEEKLDTLEMRWGTHSSDWSFFHRTVRPFEEPLSPLLKPTLKSWTFKHPLDPVQSRAIACVESGDSVLVCAPTSAGKTAVATYAVAMALHSKKRAIYTTPIKALSNQKFLELGKAFGGQYVGIMTGDTVIASDAPIVVMTLEILQSMLYKQARDPNLLDDFQCVVLDEAHFLGDLERGYAWEEVLILTPLHVQMVLLSATMPNSESIADWCARIRMQPMHVITSDQRPVAQTSM